MSEVFEARYARNGRGKPDTVAPPLKSQNGGTGKGDGAPLVYDPNQMTSKGYRSVPTPGLSHTLPATANSPLLTSSPAGFHAKICPLPESGAAWPVTALASSSSLRECWERFSPSGALSRMFLDFSAHPPKLQDVISQSCSMSWRTSGIAAHGEYWTQDTPEYPNGAVESTLSDILESSVPPRYYLSPRACAGILRRAERRGKALPPHLEQALRATADTGAT